MSKNKESLIKQLTQKPWEPAQAKVDNLHEGKTFNLHVGKIPTPNTVRVTVVRTCTATHTEVRELYDDLRTT